MPIGLLSALIAGGTGLLNIINNRQASNSSEGGLQYQRQFLSDYAIPALTEYTLPAMRRRSDLESALWPLIVDQLRESLTSPGAASPKTQGLYRAIRDNWLQEQSDSKKRIAMDLAARGGIRSGGYLKRLIDIEGKTSSGLSALYADLINRRQQQGLSLASSILGSGPSQPTISQIGNLAGRLSSRSAPLSEYGQSRGSSLLDILSTILR